MNSNSQMTVSATAMAAAAVADRGERGQRGFCHSIQEQFLQGLRAPGFEPASIEQELSGFLEEFSPCGVRCEISVSGRPRELRPAVQEQINLIGREALVNALLHSTATRIEADIEYSPRRVRVLVRDNGCGIDPCVVQNRKESHWGLLGMRERAESIGARLTIWSRPGAGTEVEVSVPSQALAEACA